MQGPGKTGIPEAGAAFDSGTATDFRSSSFYKIRPCGLFELTSSDPTRPVIQMRKAPIMHLRVHPGVAGLAGEFPCQEGGDDRLAVRPPELHIVPVFLDRLAADVGEKLIVEINC